MQVIPDGFSWEQAADFGFVLQVEYRGTGEDGKDRWRVVARYGAVELSRAGNWKFMPQRFQWHQYRWETMDEALTMARRHIETVRVNLQTPQMVRDRGFQPRITV